MSRTWLRLFALVLLAFGSAGGLLLDRPSGSRDLTWPLVLLGCVLAGTSPWACRVGTRLYVALRRPAARSVAPVMLAIWIAAMGAYALIGWTSGAYFGLQWHDEHVYRIQSHMLLSGAWSQPAHPVADAVEGVNLLHAPRYAAEYFPGTAMLHLPGLVLGLPFWVTSLAFAGAAVALAWRVVLEISDGLTAALVVIFLVLLRLNHGYSTMLLAHFPALACIMAAWLWGLWCLRGPRWGRSPGAGSGWRWPLGFGLATAMALLTRPADAIVMLLPLWAVLLWQFRRSLGRLALASLPLVGAVAVQAWCNRATTGDAWLTPFSLYAQRYYPGTGVWEHWDSSMRPQTQSPQKLALYDAWARPYLVARESPVTGAIAPRFRGMLRSGLPHVLLLGLALTGVWLAPRRARLLLAAIPLFLAVYGGYGFFLPNYVLLVAPVLCLLVALGIRGLFVLWPRQGPRMGITFVGLALCLSLTALPRLTPRAAAGNIWLDYLRNFDAQVSALPVGSILLVPPGTSPIPNPGEMVFSSSSASVDASRVVVAHDLGPRNRELWNYYAGRGEGDRLVYVCRPMASSVACIGSVRDLVTGAP